MKYALLVLALLAVPAPAHEKHRAATPAKKSPAQAAPEARAAVAESIVWKTQLKQPEYWHILINPIPPLGMSAASVLLAASLVPAAEALAVPGLVLAAVAGIAAFPAIYSGEKAYDRLSDRLPPEAQQWLDVHMARAEKRQLLFYLTAAMAIAALVQRRRKHKSAKRLQMAALVLTLASAGLAGWIAHSGGQVSHAEFRQGPPTAEDLKFAEGE